MYDRRLGLLLEWIMDKGWELGRTEYDMYRITKYHDDPTFAQEVVHPSLLEAIRVVQRIETGE